MMKSPITGQDSAYTQFLALWDELGLQGWLKEDEQTIKSLVIRVALTRRLYRPKRI